MRPPAPIADYLDALTRELRFDPQLSQRVRREVEDHLLDAVAEAAGICPEDAAHAAIARFGDPRLIARHYAPSSLLQQTRRAGGIVIFAIAAILVLMKGRVALYEALQWRVNPDWLGGLGTIGPVINRYVFQVAIVLGILGWLYIASRRPAATINDDYQHELKRCLRLSAAASALLIATIALDTILGGMRIAGAGMSLAAAIPLVSIAVEIGLAAAVIMGLYRIRQRKALVASLFADESASCWK
jgi:hypothetical protein